MMRVILNNYKGEKLEYFLNDEYFRPLINEWFDSYKKIIWNKIEKSDKPQSMLEVLHELMEGLMEKLDYCCKSESIKEFMKKIDIDDFMIDIEKNQQN